MVYFITFMRALAAIIITNSHYTGVYPTDLIANGGLLGNCLFFAISGYCLANVKLSFGKWYLKRIIRVYPQVVILTGVYLLCGINYMFGLRDFIKLFVYPTQFHFVAAILALYILFYVVMRIDALKSRLPLVVLGVFAIQLIVYIFFFDRSVYHIDSVFSHMIRFLYFIAMLIGAYIKVNDLKFRNQKSVLNIVMTLVFCVAYFGSKMFFVKFSDNEFICQFQIVNQIILSALVYFILALFAGLDSELEKLPRFIKSIINFISAMTLEIYMVQDVLVPRLKIGVFPINWLIITGGITVSAFVLHFISEKVVLLINKVVKL